MNALVFPGQGSQKAGMALEFVRKFDWANEMAQAADAILGRKISEICFQGSEEALKLTRNTQPAIFLASAIAFEALRREGFKFSAVAGHSLGEYGALYAADVAPFECLLKLVAARAEAMEQVCPAGKGTMAAVMMLERSALEKICKDAETFGPCVVANYNCPGQAVISGTVEAVEYACRKAKECGAKRAIVLDVSGAFHSPLMEPAQTLLSSSLSDIDFRKPTVPIYTNIDALPEIDGEHLKNKLLMQLTGSVLWEDSVKNMYKSGIRRFIEVGVGKVLSGLIKKTENESETFSVQDPDSLNQLLQAERNPLV